jgi:ATP-binding cassette, subfamily B, multidrug efflux pump
MNKQSRSLITRFLLLAAARRRLWAAVLIFGGLSGLASLVNPIVARFIVDDGLLKKDARQFILLVCVSAGIYVCGELVSRARDWHKQAIKLNVNFELNKKLFVHMQKLPLSWFRDKATGSNLFTLTHDVDAISDFITEGLPGFAVSLARLCCIGAIAFWLSWKLTLVIVVSAPLLYVPQKYLARRLSASCQALSDAAQDLYCYLEEKLSHMQVVKALGREKAASRGFIKRLIRSSRITLANSRTEAFFNLIGDLISKTAIGCIALYASFQVIEGRITAGALATMILYVSQMIGLLSGIFSLKADAASVLVSCERVAAVLDAEPVAADAPGARDIDKPAGDIVFDRVSFGYRPDAPVLRAVSLRVPAGSFIALAGASGCGKSTLLNLMVRIYEPQEGTIFIGAGDIRMIKRESLIACFGFAFQEPLLWNDTIANNIRYARQDATPEEIVTAARISGADEFIGSLARGYDTQIGEDACKLSEGQKQKISLARALVRRPSILILDEAMASMDSRSEEKILADIRAHYPALTIIAVSHRLSTIRCSDTVFYFTPGGSLEQGRADELLAGNNGFRSLFGTQTACGGR